jgi:hypothetical protein
VVTLVRWWWLLTNLFVARAVLSSLPGFNESGAYILLIDRQLGERLWRL